MMKPVVAPIFGSLAVVLALSPMTMAQGNRQDDAAVTAALDDSWPDRPEWVDMFADILQGKQMGPEDGWFRRAVSQTRFGWKETSARLDADGDGTIGRKEFPGSDDDFARLDRDHDGGLTEADFDFSPHALTPTPGMELFFQLDRDGNGKVTREELDRFFQDADAGKQGFLSLSDLQEALQPPRAAETVLRHARPAARPVS